jgi:hypothetical protein
MLSVRKKEKCKCLVSFDPGEDLPQYEKEVMGNIILCRFITGEAFLIPYFA